MMPVGSCCPDCGARLIRAGGCSLCPVCGWSQCGRDRKGDAMDKAKEILADIIIDRRWVDRCG
jgi:uncharacterized Zn finger protein (UPF0148 family)